MEREEKKARENSRTIFTLINSKLLSQSIESSCFFMAFIGGNKIQEELNRLIIFFVLSPALGQSTPLEKETQK